MKLENICVFSTPPVNIQFKLNSTGIRELKQFRNCVHTIQMTYGDGRILNTREWWKHTQKKKKTPSTR